MSLDMDQELAKKLLVEGATLVLLGVPEETEFGIDMKSWNTAEDFRGVKMIPPGVHFVHYSAVKKGTGDIAPRSGFMHNFKNQEFLVKLWDEKIEDISNEVLPEESIKRIKDNLLNIDRFLAPYPYDIWNKWKSLSDHISEELVKKFTPESGRIRSALEMLSCSNEDRPRGVATPRKPKNINEGASTSTTNLPESLPNTECSESTAEKVESIDTCQILASSDESNTSCEITRCRRSTFDDKEDALLPHLTPAPGTALRLSNFPLDKYPPGSTPQEITRHCLDQTYVLEYLMAQHTNSIHIIGELQFAYVCFLIGHSLDAFEHWKKLVVLLCSCEQAIKKHRFVYLHFVKAIEVQIVEIPQEFLADIVMNNNIIHKYLREFFKTALNSSIEPRLRTMIENFKINLSEELLWDFSGLDKEEDDEKPVIVHL